MLTTGSRASDAISACGPPFEARVSAFVHHAAIAPALRSERACERPVPSLPGRGLRVPGLALKPATRRGLPAPSARSASRLQLSATQSMRVPRLRCIWLLQFHCRFGSFLFHEALLRRDRPSRQLIRTRFQANLEDARCPRERECGFPCRSLRDARPSRRSCARSIRSRARFRRALRRPSPCASTSRAPRGTGFSAPRRRRRLHRGALHRPE